MQFDAIELLVLAVIAAAAVVATVRYWRNGEVPTVDAAIEMVGSGVSDIESAAGVAQEYVAAAEQLWASGQLEKDGRFGWALKKLHAALPGIPEETLIDSIEAAVMWMKIAASKFEENGEKAAQ